MTRRFTTIFPAPHLESSEKGTNTPTPRGGGVKESPLYKTRSYTETRALTPPYIMNLVF